MTVRQQWWRVTSIGMPERSVIARSITVWSVCGLLKRCHRIQDDRQRLRIVIECLDSG
jgi:hypothetical protein